MATVTTSVATLSYEVVGDGPPIVFIHGALVADAFISLVTEPVQGNNRLITYRRRRVSRQPLGH